MNSGHFCGSVGPAEVAAVDDRAADVHAVAADELRGGVDDDVDAVLDRPEQGRRQHRVVDDHRQAVAVRQVGDPPVIGHVVLRVARRFQVDRARVLVHESAAISRAGAGSKNRTSMPSLA